MDETPITRRALYRGPQQPTLMAYVPLPVFIAEVFVLMIAFRLFGIYAAGLIVAHMLPVVLTRANPTWLRDLVLDARYFWFSQARGLYDKAVVSYTPQRRRARYDKRHW